MAYTHPSLAEFVAIYPQFADTTQQQYDFWVEQAELITIPIEECLGQRMNLATMLLTAHYLVKAGIGSGAESEMARQGSSAFRRIKSGTIDLERGEASESETGMGDFGTTSYGRQLFPMLKACLTGPRVTATGCVSGYTGYRSGPLPWQ